jgi:hypothetical protein
VVKNPKFGQNDTQSDILHSPIPSLRHIIQPVVKSGCFGESFQAGSPETYAAHARKWYKECLGSSDPVIRLAWGHRGDYPLVI